MESLNIVDFNDVLKQRKNREDLWKVMTNYRLIVAPRSSGIDTHLIYESILLGCVPIICKNTTSYMHENSPVLILEDWSELKNDTWPVFCDFHIFRNFEKENLKLEYWNELIKEK